MKTIWIVTMTFLSPSIEAPYTRRILNYDSLSSSIEGTIWMVMYDLLNPSIGEFI